MMNILQFLLLFLLCPPLTTGWDDLPIRIKCGSVSEDFGYSGGKPYKSGYVPPVAPFPLVTGRYFPSAPHSCYTFDLPSGFFYSVRVFFGIRYGTTPFFNVSMKGTVVANLNSDWNQHLEQTFLELTHFLQNGDEFICFHRGPSSPTIMSVEVFHLPHFFPFAYDTQSYSSNIYRTHIRWNFGSNISIFDRNLDFGDRFWKGVSLLCDNGVSVRTSKSIPVPGHHYPSFLYETGIVATFDLPDLRFLIPDIVPMKWYYFSLHFCQIFGTLGSTFEIQLGRQTIHRTFNVAKMAGGINRPIVFNHTLFLMSDSLIVYLKAAEGSIAFINALEIHEVIAPESNTLYSEVLALRKIKRSLAISDNYGWNGDPCAPKNYPWAGVNCSFDKKLNLHNIIGLNLARQSLKGNLPEEFSELSCLEFLDLSNNKFEGSIPRSYLRLQRLRLLNLTGNLLHGQVPKFSKSVSLSLDGNVELCGYAGLPSCGGKSFGAVLPLIVVSVILALLVLLLVLELRSKTGKFH